MENPGNALVHGASEFPEFFKCRFRLSLGGNEHVMQAKKNRAKMCPVEGGSSIKRCCFAPCQSRIWLCMIPVAPRPANATPVQAGMLKPAKVH